MKKAVSIILACCILITVFVTAVGAETGNVVGSGNSELEAAIAAVGDKLDPSVILCLKNPTGEGRFFEISYHGVTENELITQIEAVIGSEVTHYNHGTGKVFIWLQYAFVVKVAGFDSVDYITLPTGVTLPVELRHKYTQKLEKKLLNLQDDDSINLILFLNYKDLDTSYIKQEDYDDPDDYRAAKLNALKEYAKQMHDQLMPAILAAADIEYVYDSEFMNYVLVTVKASDVQKLLVLDEIAGIDWNDTPSTPLPSPTDYDGLYEAKFAEWIQFTKYDPDTMTDRYCTYDEYEELYYHYSTQGSAPDWMLAKVHVEFYGTWDYIPYRQFGNRVLVGWYSGAAICPFDLTLYDIANDQFYHMNESNVTEENFPGLTEAIEGLELGYELGDVGMDGELDITDATIMQRYEAGLQIPLSNSIYQTLIPVIGDMDGNGFDIVDVTIVQRKLVNMA